MDKLPPVAQKKTAAKTKDKKGEESDAAKDEAADDPFAGLPSPLLAPPVTGVPNVLIDEFRIPPFLLPLYQAAGVEYGVRWEVLAAINEIETDYGRNLSVSTAGAVGWMQFMPSTWEMYGVDANGDGRKDPYNPVDAIFAAARYLRAAGAGQDLKAAIYSYNHAGWYVDDVLARARGLAALPTEVVGALTGLTMGRPPVTGKVTYDGSTAFGDKTDTKDGNATVAIAGSATRRSANVYARPGAAAVAVQDGKVVRIGKSKRLGRFVRLRDAYGNTYTYGHLDSVAELHAVPRHEDSDRAGATRAPEKDPAPTSAATAGARGAASASASSVRAATATGTARPKAVKERLFADPARPNAYHAGGERQIASAQKVVDTTPQTVAADSLGLYLAKPYALRREQVSLLPLREGSRVIAGTILGHLGGAALESDDVKAASAAAAKLEVAQAPNLLFEIRPAGSGAPRIDPTPILDGWKLLSTTEVYRSASPMLGERRLGHDRPDPADEQGAAGAPRARRQGRRDLRLRASGHPRRHRRPPRPRDARVPRRQRPEADGGEPALRPRLLHEERQRLRAQLRVGRRHRRDQRHADPRPPGRGLDHRHRRAPPADAAGHDEGAPDHHAHAVRGHGQHVRDGRPRRSHPRRLPAALRSQRGDRAQARRDHQAGPVEPPRRPPLSDPEPDGAGQAVALLRSRSSSASARLAEPQVPPFGGCAVRLRNVG